MGCGYLLNLNWCCYSISIFINWRYAAHTNNGINSKINHETYTHFQLSLGGGGHIVKLTTSPFPHKYYFWFISLVGRYVYLYLFSLKRALFIFGLIYNPQNKYNTINKYRVSQLPINSLKHKTTAGLADKFPVMYRLWIIEDLSWNDKYFKEKLVFGLDSSCLHFDYYPYLT